MQWKYALGEVLVFRATLFSPLPTNNIRLFVLERLSRECPGGTQLFYECRPVAVASVNVSVPHDAIRVLEQEVAPYSEYAALLAEQNKQDDARFEALKQWRKEGR